MKGNVSYRLKAALHLLVDAHDSTVAGRTKMSLLKGLQLDEVPQVEFILEVKLKSRRSCRRALREVFGLSIGCLTA